MSTGRKNKLTGQIGEYIVCAELAKRDYITTSFTGNVPEIDIIIVTEELKVLPVQVKTSRSHSWPTSANLWINIEIDEKEQKQIDNGDKTISNPDLIYICVLLVKPDSDKNDKFFILKKSDIQSICVKNYRNWMNKHNWKRPRNYKSLDNRYYLEDLIPFENNWKLIETEIEKS